MARLSEIEFNDLVVNFYDEAADYKKETFAQIKTRVMGDDPWSSEEFKREVRKMFDLARGPRS